MKHYLFLCLFWVTAVFGQETDYDYIVVGSSPISLFEAIYKTCLGNRVLVVEQSSRCGGAWKSIDICGIQNVDLGCHEIGRNDRLKPFLEEYAGCSIVLNAPPNVTKGDFGIYPKGGCHELTANLQFLMQVLGTSLMLNSKLESIFIETHQDRAYAKINGSYYSTSKFVVTNCSDIKVENNACSYNPKTSKHYHIYLLITDPTPSRFTYIYLPKLPGVSRAMNLSRYVGLEETGHQLIAIQVYNENYLYDGMRYFEELKLKDLIDPSAQLLCCENYVYEQPILDRKQLNLNGRFLEEKFEILDAGHIVNIGRYSEKWKTAMRPWKEVVEGILK